MTICISGCWRIQKHHFAAVQSETEAFESINISATGRKPALRITIANSNTISWMNYSVYLLPFAPQICRDTGRVRKFGKTMVEKVLRFFFDYAMIAANSAI